MKILVPVKRVPDPDQRVKVNEAGTGIAEEDVTFVINPFDEIALEEALRIRENATDGDVEILAVGIGNDDYEKELRTALALGVDRVLLVETDSPPDSWGVACILQAVVDRESPDLVLMGKQAVDDDCHQAGQFLAAALDWPQATCASSISFADGGIRVDRETDDGIETVWAGLPALVTADLRLNEPRYASLPSIMKAKRKPVDRVPVGELGVTPEPRATVLEMEALSARRDGVTVTSVDELLTRLREEAKVL